MWGGGARRRPTSANTHQATTQDGREPTRVSRRGSRIQIPTAELPQLLGFDQTTQDDLADLTAPPRRNVQVDR